MTAQSNTIPPIKPHGGVKVEVAEYDPITGEVTRKLTSLNFDRTTLLHFSTPIVIKMNVVGVQKIDNIQLGITKCSFEITSGGTTNSDGTKTSGNVGIEHSRQLSQKTSLTSFFAGINTVGSPADTSNVSIRRSSDTESEYIYINLQMPETTGRGYIGLKWFFDFI